MSRSVVVATRHENAPIEEESFAVFELSLDSSSDVAGLTDAMRSLNTSVEEVRVDLYNSFTSRWGEEGVGYMFQVLGDVHHILRIEFYGLRIFPYIMPIAMAEQTLAHATSLQEFSLAGIHLTAASPLEFRRFSDTLRRHISLKVFGLDNCRLRNVSERAGPTLDAIVAALLEISTLEKVVIRAYEESRWSTLSCSSVALLCSSPTLKTLELFVFSDCGNSVLKEMAQSLIENHDSSQLEDVCISGCLGGVTGATIVSEMIQTNTKLKSLELHLREMSEEEDEAGIIEISKALAKNRTLEKFQLHGATDKAGSVETRRAYLQMLQSNYTLKHSVELFHPGFLRPDNEMYLKLNQVGRGRLLENVNATKKDWVNTLHMVGHDLDCLYYLLRRNPLLCAPEPNELLVCCETPNSFATPAPEVYRKRKRSEDGSAAARVTP